MPASSPLGRSLHTHRWNHEMGMGGGMISLILILSEYDMIVILGLVVVFPSSDRHTRWFDAGFQGSSVKIDSSKKEAPGTGAIFHSFVFPSVFWSKRLLQQRWGVITSRVWGCLRDRSLATTSSHSRTVTKRG